MTTHSRAPRTPSAFVLAHMQRCFAYDCDTGIVTWRERFNHKGSRVRVGEPVGFQRDDGYLFIVLKWEGTKRSYLLHRIAWFLHHGEWPTGLIDHIDRNPSNNRIANLRYCTHAQNAVNVNRIQRGVNFYKRTGKWRAYLADGQHIGYFDTREEALVAADAARKERYGKYAS